MRRRVLILGWVMVLGISAILPVSAVFHGIVHVGPSAMVTSAFVRRPIISLGGDVDVGGGSGSIILTVLGDVFVRNTVSNDIVSVGGVIHLEPKSRVRGDVVSVAGGIVKASSATVDGRLGGSVLPLRARGVPSRPSPGALAALNVRLGLAAGLALMLIGTCLTIVFPWQVVLIATTLRDSPLKSAAAGLMNLIIFVFLVVPLGLSLAGLPFALLLTGAATLAWLLGLTAGAVVMGRFLARGSVSLVWATTAGLLALALMLTIPVLGVLAIAGLGMTGAGALAVALVTRSRPTRPFA